MPRLAHRPRVSRKVRSVALGVVLGLTTAAGTIALAGASGEAVANAFVPITPCRLMDTRPNGTVGPRNTPIGPNETYSAQVIGLNGQCDIPATATAIVVNVTGIAPTARTFVTIFPSDATRPNASNLNFVAGQAPTPNLVTVSVSATGAISIFNSAGTVHLLADIAGYYQPVAPGPPGPAGNPNRASTQQIAMLQWGNLTFPTGADPYDIAYDGSSIWITNRSANTVSKLDPLTGERTAFPTGAGPRGIAFDGTYVWVANYAADTVSRFVPATGGRTDFPTGDGPEALAWDGFSLWISNTLADTVWSMDPASGLAAEYAAGDAPAGIAFDGQVIWVANTAADTVTRIEPSTGSTSSIPVGDSPYGVAFDGTFIWVTNEGSDTLTRVDRFSLTTTDFGAVNGPRGIAVAGTELWVGNTQRNFLSRYDAAGARTDLEILDAVGEMAYDGRSLWVLTASQNSVMRMVLP